MRGIIICMFTMIFASLQAQYDHEDVFAGKTGEELKNLLIENFKPEVVLGYGAARDEMYGNIYNVNDSVAGIYSDHKVYLKPGDDPSTGVFMNGEPNGINAEHSYPQSKGAGNGNARSDMHHLFPSRVGTNSARGSLPFGEINDNITQTWYYKTIETPVDPSLDVRDNYSEKSSGFWEPREEVKGNVARAIFYFYTMYQQQADGSDPNFFDIQKDILCEWHYLDPVDKLEWERTYMIADKQEDKANPFVLDCTLAGRLYCPIIDQACLIVNVEEEELKSFSLKQNPFQEEILIDGAFAQNEIHSISVFNMLGANVEIGEIQTSSSGISLHVGAIPQGAYFIRIAYVVDGTIQSQILKAIKTN